MFPRIMGGTNFSLACGYIQRGVMSNAILNGKEVGVLRIGSSGMPGLASVVYNVSRQFSHNHQMEKILHLESADLSGLSLSDLFIITNELRGFKHRLRRLTEIVDRSLEKAEQECWKRRIQMLKADDSSSKV